MGAPSYHGWTHRPKAQGGTDPIEVPSIKTAIFSEGLRTMSITGGSTVDMDFRSLYSNDPSFGYLSTFGTSPKRARYIEVTEEGLYFVQGTVYISESTLFSGTDAPYIELTLWYPSLASRDFLINSVGPESWNDGQSPIYGEMFVASEYAHQQMVETAWFNFDKAWFGETSMGIGVCIGASNSVTKGLAGMVQVSRMGDLLTETVVA